MISDSTTIKDRATELRLAFDRSFAEAPANASTPTEAFLGIGAGNGQYALRLAEISGLYADKKIVPVPSESTDLLGITSFRGALVPIYDLQLMLGYAAATTPRWLVLMASKTPAGIAFERFDGYFAATRDAIATDISSERRQPHINETVRVLDQSRPVVSLVSMLDSIRKRTHQGVLQRGQ